MDDPETSGFRLLYNQHVYGNLICEFLNVHLYHFLRCVQASFFVNSLPDFGFGNQTDILFLNLINGDIWDKYNESSRTEILRRLRKEMYT